MPREELEFECDDRKAAANKRKHNITFEEASTVLADPLSLTITDPDFVTMSEPRYVTIRSSYLERLIVVVHCDRSESIRFISARRATRSERKTYEEKSRFGNKG